jgi:prepilin-type N-terminal cleavage/methylation domain-containing protein
VRPSARSHTPTCLPAPQLTFSPAHPLTCSADRSSAQKGFTLLELIAVVSIMILSVALMTPVLTNEADQSCFTNTVESMAEIRKAVLGTTSDRVKGDVRFAGYVQDMGALPQLMDGQPKGLWTNDPEETPDNEDDDLSYKNIYWHDRIDFIQVGWRGPYIKPPPGGVLADGWKNPLVFQRIGDDLVITSLGADGKEGGVDFNRDIHDRIRKGDWTGSVCGYVSPQSVLLENRETDPITVRIYVSPLRPAPPDCRERGDLNEGGTGYDAEYCVACLETAPQADGYFCFPHVPIGTQRLLQVNQETAGHSHGYKIAVEPGIMWMGTLALIH